MGVSIAAFLQEFRNPRFSNKHLLIPDMMFMPGTNNGINPSLKNQTIQLGSSQLFEVQAGG
jgi:hypothetical protein